VIADETPGVTRDRVELSASWRGREFRVIDTGGYLHRARGIDALVSAQAERAAGQADVVLLVVDGQTGPTEEDSALVRRLRRASVPVVLVVNKVDTPAEMPGAAAFYGMGLGEPAMISALHGRGCDDLLDRVIALLPTGLSEPEREVEPRFAIIGRPNVGKSSLFNRLVGEERSVVFREGGTTRDSVDAVVEWPSGPVRFVDTAGLRPATRARGIEYYSLVRAGRAIERAHVAALVIDATEGFTAGDRRIAARVMDAGRGLAVVANKWDLVEEKGPVFRQLGEETRSFASAPVVRTSATAGTGVAKLAPCLLALHERWSRRFPTAEVNRVLQEAQGERPAPGRTKFRYGTQVTAGPPVFVIFGGGEPEPSYGRFLENRLRRAFGLEGVPIRLRFRAKRHRRSG
jgi:GTP-binding protein